MSEKEGNSVRFRLFFDDRHLLNKSQRSQGLRRCWIFLKPGLATVGDLASHIRESFGFSDRIVLSVDDFVLPAFESTSIITDKDIIRVTKKEVKQKDICRPYDGQNLLQDSQIVRVKDLAFSKDILADGNYQESSQGNGSYDKEILISCMENAVHVSPSSGDNVTAKRKRENSNQLLGLKGQCDETEHHHEFEPRNCCDVRKQNDVHKNQPRLQMIRHTSDREEDVVPVVVLPGHIRFEQREDIGQQTDGTQHSLLFNGVSSTNIQNWIEEKNLPETNNDEQCKSDGVWSDHQPEVKISSSNIMGPEVISSPNIMGPHKHLKHFESLAPLSRLPLKGDVLAYRYFAQSSSLYRELSFPQVGKVSLFDNKSLQIILVPVPDYEICLDENRNGAILQQNVLLDQESGSSEIDYSSLVDVRLLKAHDSEEAASHVDPARKDGWEEALAKGNSNAPNAAAADKSDGWAQWIPNMNTSASWTSKHANAPLTGRNNGGTNPAPNRSMINWAMNKCTTYRTANRNSTIWTPNMGNPRWTPHVTATPAPWYSPLGTATPTPWSYRPPRMNLPWGSHPNKMVLHGGNPGSG